VIEAAVLHHHDDHVLDPAQVGAGQQIQQAGVTGLAAEKERATGSRRRALKKSSSGRSLGHSFDRDAIRDAWHVAGTFDPRETAT
jgi:hypothetical protein